VLQSSWMKLWKPSTLTFITEIMCQPVQNAEVIKAWADGIIVQYEYDCKWVTYPSTHNSNLMAVGSPKYSWRIKPTRTPGEVLATVLYNPLNYSHSPPAQQIILDRAAQAVIEAFNSGEFNNWKNR